MTQLDPAGATPCCSPTAAWPADSRFLEAAGEAAGDPAPQPTTPVGAPTPWFASSAIPLLLDRLRPEDTRQLLPVSAASPFSPRLGSCASSDRSVARVAVAGLGASSSGSGPSVSVVPCPSSDLVSACVVSLAIGVDTPDAR